jgi:hypothetical protein
MRFLKILILWFLFSAPGSATPHDLIDAFGKAFQSGDYSLAFGELVNTNDLIVKSSPSAANDLIRGFESEIGDYGKLLELRKPIIHSFDNLLHHFTFLAVYEGGVVRIEILFISTNSKTFMHSLSYDTDYADSVRQRVRSQILTSVKQVPIPNDKAEDVLPSKKHQN